MTPTPDDIRKARETPEDIWEKARALRNRCVWASNSSTETIAQALAEEREAERERCAGIAETHGVYPELNTFAGGPEWYRHGREIAKAIRRSEP